MVYFYCLLTYKNRVFIFVIGNPEYSHSKLVNDILKVRG